MNRDAGTAATIAADAVSALRPAPAAKSSELDMGATQAYRPEPDTASRVLNQLNGITSSLHQAAPQGKQPAAAQHADEECLESYLQRYMQQLTGKNQEPSAGAAAATPTDESKQSGEPVDAEAKASPRQPAQAPEDRLRITAMRELANDSARRVMAESTNSQLIGKTRTTYVVTKILSLLSITVLVCYFATDSTIALASGAVLLGAAMLFACRFAGFCRKMRPGAAPSM